MRYIQSITLENFQSYLHKTTISFCDGFNAILGTSDAGKSTILRAIDYVKSNRPLGLGYVGDGDGPLKIAIAFSDGVKLERIRGKNDNSYCLYGADGDLLRKEETVGADVPQFVGEILNIGDHNISIQFAPMYLVQASAPAAAKTINSIVGFDSVDSAIDIGSAEIRTLSRQKTAVADKLGMDKTKLAALDGLDGLGDSIAEARKMNDRCLNLVDQHDEILSLCSSITADYKTVNQGNIVLKEVDCLISDADGVYADIGTISQDVGILGRLVGSADIESKILQMSDVLPDGQMIEGCLAIIKEIQSVAGEIGEIQTGLLEIKLAKDKVSTLNAEMAGLVIRAKAILADIDECPFCGGEIGDIDPIMDVVFGEGGW